MIHAYFDTSVILPALVANHPHHEVCLNTMESVLQEGNACTVTHTLAELYSNLTKLPHGYSIPPLKAKEAIIEQLVNSIQIIDLTRADYESALKRCAHLGLGSGIVYDALHLQAAIKAKTRVLYTANLKDFQRLADDKLPFEIKQP